MVKRLFPALTIGLVLSTGCTADRSSSATSSSAYSQTSTAAQAAGTAKVAARTCSPEEVAVFERLDGDVFEVERESLPRGLYLATVTELLVEKRNTDKTNASPVARMIVRETPGAGVGEVACAENVDHFGESFELGLAGVVKFETDEHSQGSGFVTRQFFVYSDKTGYGVVLSSPKLIRPSNLKQAFGADSGAQLAQVDEKTFVVKYLKERDGVRARLLVRLELLPQQI